MSNIENSNDELYSCSINDESYSCSINDESYSCSINDESCPKIIVPYKEDQIAICKQKFIILDTIFIPTTILLLIMEKLNGESILNFALVSKKLACLYRSNIQQKNNFNDYFFVGDCSTKITKIIDYDIFLNKHSNNSFNDNTELLDNYNLIYYPDDHDKLKQDMIATKKQLKNLLKSNNYDCDLYKTILKIKYIEHICPVCNKYCAKSKKHCKQYHPLYCSTCNENGGNNCADCMICQKCGNKGILKCTIDCID